MATSITLRQLEYFVAAARAGTRAGAAGALHVSPAAVSLGIAELERTLGGELFRRVAHQPLVLTSTGQDLLADATTIVSDVRDLEQRVDDRSTISGVLHVGCFATLAPFVVPRLVAAVAATHPHLRVEVAEDDAAGVQRAVLDGRTELAVLYGIDLRAGLEATTVTTMRPYVVLPADHRLATRRRVRLGELAADPIILLESPPSQLHTRAVLQAAGIIAAGRAGDAQLRDSARAGGAWLRVGRAGPAAGVGRQLRGPRAGHRRDRRPCRPGTRRRGRRRRDAAFAARESSHSTRCAASSPGTIGGVRAAT